MAMTIFTFKSFILAMMAALVALLSFVLFPLVQLVLKKDFSVNISSIILQDLCHDPANIDIHFVFQTSQNLQIQVTELSVQPRLKKSSRPLATAAFSPKTTLALARGTTQNDLRVTLSINDPVQLNTLTNNLLAGQIVDLDVAISLRVSLASWLPWIPINKTIKQKIDPNVPTPQRKEPSLEKIGFTEEGHVKLTVHVGVPPEATALRFEEGETNALGMEANIEGTRVAVDLIGIHDTKEKEVLEIELVVRAPELQVFNLLDKLVSGERVDVELTGGKVPGKMDCRVQQVLRELTVKYTVVESKERKSEGVKEKLKKTWDALKEKVSL